MSERKKSVPKLKKKLTLYEAAGALTLSFRKKYSEIPWKKIVGMRNIIVHDYFQIDQKIVWSVVVTELPKLKGSIQNILGLV